MHRGGEAGGVVEGADHQAAGAGAILLELDAIEQQAVGDAAGCEHHVGAGGELLGLVDLVRVGDAHFCQAGEVAFTGEALPLLGLCHGRVVDELTLEMAAQGAQGGSGNHAFRGGADAHQAMGSRAGETGGDGGLHIAIGDRLHTGAGGTDLSDQILVAGAVHHHDHQFVLGHAEALAEDVNVFGGRLADVHLAFGSRRGRQLLHVEVGGVEEATAVGGGEYGHRATLAVSAQVGALAGIHGEVHTRARAAAHLFTDVKHRGLVALPLADHDAALHGDLAHALAHRLDRGGIGLVFQAHAGEAGGGDGGLFDDLENFLDERAIHDDPAGEGREASRANGRHPGGNGCVGPPPGQGISAEGQSDGRSGRALGAAERAPAGAASVRDRDGGARSRTENLEKIREGSAWSLVAKAL